MKRTDGSRHAARDSEREFELCAGGETVALSATDALRMIAAAERIKSAQAAEGVAQWSTPERHELHSWYEADATPAEIEADARAQLAHIQEVKAVIPRSTGLSSSPRRPRSSASSPRSVST